MAPAPSERTKFYVEKLPSGRWTLAADFVDLLPAGVTLASSGHTIKAFDLTGADVTDALVETATLQASGTKLEVVLKQTPVEATPTILGTYALLFLGKTSQEMFEPVLVYLHVRPEHP